MAKSSLPNNTSLFNRRSVMSGSAATAGAFVFCRTNALAKSDYRDLLVRLSDQFLRIDERIKVENERYAEAKANTPPLPKIYMTGPDENGRAHYSFSFENEAKVYSMPADDDYWKPIPRHVKDARYEAWYERAIEADRKYGINEAFDAVEAENIKLEALESEIMALPPSLETAILKLIVWLHANRTGAGFDPDDYPDEFLVAFLDEVGRSLGLTDDRWRQRFTHKVAENAGTENV